jgi:hypothetical protein
MKRRIRRELRSLSENTPIFPWLTHLRVSILFVARTDKDIDNTLKPFLDVLEPWHHARRSKTHHDLDYMQLPDAAKHSFSLKVAVHIIVADITDCRAFVPASHLS